MPEVMNKPAVAHGRRKGPTVLGGWLVRTDSIVGVCTVLTVVLTALTLHNELVTIGVGVAGGGWVLVGLLTVRIDADRRRSRKLAGLARQLQNGLPPALVVLPLDAGDSTPLIDDLEKLLRENERLCVIRLHGEGTLEAPLGLVEDTVPPAVQCEVIVGRISWELEKAAGLSVNAESAAKYLRAVAGRSLRKSDSTEVLRSEVAKALQGWKIVDQLVPLADARRADLALPAGKWLLQLFGEDLHRPFGISYTQEAGDKQSPQNLPPERIRERGPWEWEYVSGILGTRLPARDARAVFQPLCDAVGDDLGLNLELLDIRCAVLVAASELGEQAEPLDRLIRPPVPMASAPEVQEQEAMLAVRWLIDRKAARLTGTTRRVTGAFDTLAVAGQVTPRTFCELMRDLGLSAERSKELYDWLCGNEFDRAGIVESAADGISLGRTVRDAALGWLSEEQPAAYHIAAERYYRVCLVLDRAHVPPPGYTDLVAPGYGGLHLYESPDWWADFYVWGGHAAEISSAPDRKGAEIAITCLFLETWWWWGDQLRLEAVDKVLGMARKILRDQPAWIGAFDDFDKNYLPELDQRAAAGTGERWKVVAAALGFIAGRLDLRKGDIPADPVLARIYIVWCFFSGDVAQQTGNLAASDGWFREAARSCGDDEDNRGMRAFAYYQQADVWIPADTDRSLKVIRDTGLADAAAALEDLSLQAYLARMYGDIRWKSGDIHGAFDAYGRALLHAYVYQVDQEWDEQPPNQYSYALYSEMRTRFLQRLDDAREDGRASEADAAIERIRSLFGPYWELNRATVDGDPLAGVAPPLPDLAVLDDLNSAYAADARLMLTDKLSDQIEESADQPLEDPPES
jgi:hypothetical protein